MDTDDEEEPGLKVSCEEEVAAAENIRTRSGRVSKPSVRRVHPGITQKLPQVGVNKIGGFRHKKQTVAGYRTANPANPIQVQPSADRSGDEAMTSNNGVLLNGGFASGFVPESTLVTDIGTGSDVGNGGGGDRGRIPMCGVQNRPKRQPTAYGSRRTGIGRILVKIRGGIHSLRSFFDTNASENAKYVTDDSFFSIKEVARVFREEKR